VLSAEASILSLDITSYESSERALPISAEIDVHDLDATENSERYITGEEKIPRILSMYCCSNISQTLLSNVRRPTSTTELSLISNSLFFLDSRTRRAKF